MASERDAPAFLTPPAVHAAAPGEWAALAQAPDRRRALGSFLRHLARGEEVARVAAESQAALCDDRRLVRFFRAQARQETAHRSLFDATAFALGAAPLRLARDPYAEFDRLIARASARGHVLEIVVGTQVVLEALGEALLSRLEAGLVRCGAGFVDIRRRILEQEATHHAFGMQWTSREVWARRTDHASLRALSAPYVALGDAMIAEGAASITHFGLTSEAIRGDFRDRLPVWAKLP